VLNIRAYNIAATGTLTVGGVDSACRLYSINVNTGAASAVATVYDGTAATGRKIATIDASAAKSLIFGGSVCKDGVTLVLSGGNADITVNAG
jgi:hypothetical protein